MPLILEFILSLLILAFAYFSNFHFTTPFIGVRLTLIDTLNDLRSLPTLSRRLKNLELQNQELLVKAQNYESLSKELSLYKTNTHYQLVPVTLCSSTIVCTDTRLLKPGQAVVSGSTLIGIVKDVLQHTASIELLTNLHSPLIIITNKNVSGEYSSANFVPTISNIDTTQDLTIGDTIFTAGNDNLPKNLLIGKIKNLISVPSNPTQTAQIELSGSLPDSFSSLAVIVNF